MKFTTPLAITFLAASATAQTINPLAAAESALSYLSSSCQQVVISLVTPTSSIYQCLHIPALAPLIATNGSIIPPIDSYLSTVCSSAPCSNATLTNVTAQITAGCASDLAKYKISNATVAQVLKTYPLAREVACLKTTKPFNASNATLPTSRNTTNGTFCATSLLTELTSYLGTNLTIPYITTTALQIYNGNYTVANMVAKIPPTALCNDCIFAGLDLIEEQYPALGRVNITKGLTVNGFFNSTCNATGFSVTRNGTLPSTIYESAVNSTFPYNITIGNITTPAATSSLLVARGEPVMKKRWFGAY